MNLRNMFYRKTGLALGGGGARGLAHIGLIKVLEEERIPVHYIAGTSIGSIVGALYSLGYRWRDMADFARKVEWGKILNLSFPHLGLFNTSKMKKLFDGIFEGKCIEDLKIPFGAVTVDIVTGEEVLITKGDITTAVMASSCLPGLFEPVRWNGHLLVDGGIRNNVPINRAREMGAQAVIGMDLRAEPMGTHQPRNALDVFFASYRILSDNASHRHLTHDDILLSPDLREYGYGDLTALDRLIAEGENVTRKNLDHIMNRIRWLPIPIR